METLIEAVPNFSEGKNKETINAILESITSISDITLLNYSSDIDHNRSVVTFTGPPEKVTEAAFQATKTAAKLIDLNKHKGVHPRIGATDVIPLIPLKGISFEECIKYAKELGERIGEELKIPVYLYGKAAQKEERKNLANIRNGGYENLKKEIEEDPGKAPDFGPKFLGPAGATVVGVRNILIAFNVNLKTDDVSIAKKIAQTIRFSNNGLKYIKALGLKLENTNFVQVSMNLTNYKETPPQTVFNLIKKEVEKYGVEILESELIGLIPEDALQGTTPEELKIKNFNQSKILKP